MSQIPFVVVSSSLADLSYSFSFVSKTLRNLLFVYDNSCFGSFFHRLFGFFIIILFFFIAPLSVVAEPFRMLIWNLCRMQGTTDILSIQT